MNVSAYHIETTHPPNSKSPYPDVVSFNIPGDWFPFIPRVGDCFWHKGVYWQIKSLAYGVGEGSHENIYIELMVFYAGQK